MHKYAQFDQPVSVLPNLNAVGVHWLDNSPIVAVKFGGAKEELKNFGVSGDEVCARMDVQKGIFIDYPFQAPTETTRKTLLTAITDARVKASAPTP